MSEISSDYQVSWYRVPLPREQLEALNRRSDLLGLAQSLGFLAVWCTTAATAVWLASQGLWWWLIPALLLHGTVAAFLINGVHELVHGTVFRSRWLNALFVHLFAFLGWHNHRGFWASHQEHHLFTLHDPQDQEEVMPQSIGQVRQEFLGSFVNVFAILREIRGKWRVALGRHQGAWQQHLLDGQERRFAVHRWARWLLVGHAAIAAVSLWYGLWIVPVVTSLTPCYGRTVQWCVNKTQHLGLPDHVADFRINCRTVLLNPVLRFLYWHMNWHIEHHMFAAVPCYRLGALHRAIAHELPPSSRGLCAAWFEILGILWRQRREPGYRFIAGLPGAATIAETGSHAPRRDTTSLAASPRQRRQVWRCAVCGFIYDEALGLPGEGIAPGTAWAEIPADWRCPDCGIGKADFVMVALDRPLPHPAASVPAGDREPVVIVGSGLAGYTLAREIRRLDGARPITVLSADDGAFYSKPALSTALADGRDPAGLVLKSAAQMAEDLAIAVRSSTTVTAIDRDSRTLTCADGAQPPYGRLVLALGAEQIRLPLEGDAADRVLHVNDLAAYAAFRARLPACGGRVLIIGAGLIGCEFADDLAGAGHDVTVVDVAVAPLGRLLPAQLGALLRERLAQGGVQWRLGTSVARVDALGDALTVTFADGGDCIVDLVLSAVGLRPHTALAAAAGLATARGIVVDARLHSSDPAISALGDCAEVDGQVRPFVLPLMAGARALARTLCGTPTPVVDEPMPVTVKTPSLPLLILPPPPETSGTWQVEPLSDGAVARYRGDDGRLLAWALAGATAVALQEQLLAEMRAPQALAS